MINVVFDWVTIKPKVSKLLDKEEYYTVAHQRLKHHGDSLVNLVTELYMEGITGNYPNDFIKQGDVVKYLPLDEWFKLYFIENEY